MFIALTILAVAIAAVSRACQPEVVPVPVPREVKLRRSR